MSSNSSWRSGSGSLRPLFGSGGGDRTSHAGEGQRKRLRVEGTNGSGGPVTLPPSQPHSDPEDEMWGDDDNFLYQASQIIEREFQLDQGEEDNRDSQQESERAHDSQSNQEKMARLYEMTGRRENHEAYSKTFQSLEVDELKRRLQELEEQVKGVKEENFGFQGEVSMLRKAMEKERNEKLKLQADRLRDEEAVRTRDAELKKEFEEKLKATEEQLRFTKIELQRGKFQLSAAKVPSPSPSAPTVIRPPGPGHSPVPSPTNRLNTTFPTRESFLAKEVGVLESPLELKQKREKEEEEKREKERLDRRATRSRLILETHNGRIHEIIGKVRVEDKRIKELVQDCLKKFKGSNCCGSCSGSLLDPYDSKLFDATEPLMLLFHWTNKVERQRLRREAGIKEKVHVRPPRSFQDGPPARDLNDQILDILEGDEGRGGGWKVLPFLRKTLMRIIQEIRWPNTTALFLPNRLTILILSLIWGYHMWSIHELEKKVQKIRFGEVAWDWMIECGEWSRIVLDIAWRYFGPLRLRMESRDLTLKLLHRIVTSGYFEPTKSNYYRLYAILLSTLKDKEFLKVEYLTLSLEMIEYLVKEKDGFIFKYLCREQERKNKEAVPPSPNSQFHFDCLAEQLGNTYLELFRMEEEPYRILLTTKYLSFLRILSCRPPTTQKESLDSESDEEMKEDVEKPIRFKRYTTTEMNKWKLEHKRRVEAFIAKKAKSGSGVVEEPRTNPGPAHSISNHVDHSSSDDDETQEPMALGEGQEGSAEDELEAPVQDIPSDWLNPKDWEDHRGLLGLCQCRRHLTTAAISMLSGLCNDRLRKGPDYREPARRERVAELSKGKPLNWDPCNWTQDGTRYLTGEEKDERMRRARELYNPVLRSGLWFLHRMTFASSNIVAGFGNEGFQSYFLCLWSYKIIKGDFTNAFDAEKLEDLIDQWRDEEEEEAVVPQNPPKKKGRTRKVNQVKKEDVFKANEDVEKIFEEIGEEDWGRIEPALYNRCWANYFADVSSDTDSDSEFFGPGPGPVPPNPSQRRTGTGDVLETGTLMDTD